MYAKFMDRAAQSTDSCVKYGSIDRADSQIAPNKRIHSPSILAITILILLMQTIAL